MQFYRPIPGQSLTTTPKAAPYERPPELTDPMEAIEAHLENLTKDGVLEDITFFLEQGLDLQTLTEGILRSAVMEGIHSVDVSLIIGPVIFEFLRGVAIDSGIDFDEGLDNPDAKRAIMVQRDSVRAKKILSNMKIGGKEVKDMLSLEDADMPEEDITTAEASIEETTEDPSQGLMARRVA
jgi:hypothetical protein